MAATPPERRPSPDALPCVVGDLRVASKLLVTEGNLDTLELMMSDDVTVHILTEIRDELRDMRDEIRGTNQRLDDTHMELRGTNQRLDDTRTRLELRIDETRSQLVEAEIRTATRFVELIASSRDVHKLLVDRFDLRDRVERVEHDVAEIKTALKKQSGS